MANELKHGSVGTELTQAEWEAVGAHVFANQAAGDILYAISTSQLSRLGKQADNTVLHLASGIPAWSATLAGLTLTTPTISSTGFANANHAHAASNSGGTVAASALSGTSLASGVVTTSVTTVGTIATGVWQGTDVGVAYGGTGVSTLTQNGVLVGNGASAIGSIDMSTKGHVLIGDGSGNPQMLGVGTNNHVMTADSGETTGVKWAAPAAAAAGSLTGSTLASGVVTTSATTVGVLNSGSINTGFGTINNGSSALSSGAGTFSGILKTDDTTDATSTTDGSLQTDGGLSIAKDVIVGNDLKLLSDSAVFAMGAGSDFTITHDGATAATIDIGGSGGSITNVGAAGNDWTANSLAVVGSTTGVQAVYIHNTSANDAAGTAAYLELKVSAANGNLTGDPKVGFIIHGGSSWAVGSDNSESDRFVIANDTNLGSDTHDALRISTGEVMTVKETIVTGYDYWCDGCGEVGLTMFDCCGTVAWHDDTAALSLMSLSEEGLQHMAKIGVMEVDDSQEHRWVGINMQPAINFTWGALRQNRQRMDSQYDELNKRLEAIGA